MLVIAEDHRNPIHPGIDPIAVVRAAYATLIRRKRQGASTIEQQFVRTLLRRNESTFARKVREQLLAIAVARRRSKLDIGRAYLAIAFYGSGLIGLRALRYKCGQALHLAHEDLVIDMIARLKYPEPLKLTETWQMKMYFRHQYIRRRLRSTAA